MNQIKLKYYPLMLLLLWGSLVKADSEYANQSIALKTIRTVDDIPVIYQDEVKGGYHQYAAAPWDTIPKERIYQGMICHNTKAAMTYRYTSTAFTDGIANQNVESDWERIYVVTQHDPSKKYAEGEIVVEGAIMYHATALIDGTSATPIQITDSNWESLSTSKFRVNNQTLTTPATTTYQSGGTEIVLIKEDYTLPAASTQQGATVTIKNVKDNTNSGQVTVTAAAGEKVDGVETAVIKLFRKYDYITLVSDGTEWYKVAEGPTNVVQPTADVTAAANEHKDAFYWGDPDESGSWRVIYDEATERIIFQRRDATTWKNQTSIVP